ncbi:DNA-binding helix-turn-helix protein [Lacticaseibacillus rhamnosus ATCC 21052]|nr:DNA-binding helix-turn-helix protein [Lacticaseibacillus rhamnosus ATCC 21052]
MIILNFSKQLQQIRTAHSMTQADLAQQLHVSRHTVSNWENERNLPDLETVTQIARIFSVSLDTLILDDSELNEKLIKDSKVSRHQIVMAVLMTASLIMSGVAATTFLGFFPHWLAQVIWSIYAIVLLIWSWASDPKSTDIFASWSITSRLLIATFFSLMGLIFCLTALYLIWFRGIDVQIVLVLIGGAGLLILTKPVWPHRQHEK